MTMNDRFEQWVAREYPTLDLCRLDSGRYFSFTTDLMFSAWDGAERQSEAASLNHNDNEQT